VRRRQYGVHHQRTVDGAVLGVAGTVVVRHRQRCTGNNNNNNNNIVVRDSPHEIVVRKMLTAQSPSTVGRRSSHAPNCDLLTFFERYEITLHFSFSFFSTTV
jgi:hypothetical protein